MSQIFGEGQPVRAECLRVLYVIDSLRVSGAEMLLADTVTHGVEDGVLAPEIAVLYGGGELEARMRELGVPVHCLGLRGHADLLRGVRRFSALVRSRRPDVVHSHLFPAYVLAAGSSILGSRVPIVHTEHSASNRRRGFPWAALVENAVLRRFDLVLCVSGEVQRSLNRWAPGVADRTRVLHNGVGVPATVWASEEAKDWDLVAVARLAHPKGVDILVRAAAILRVGGRDLHIAVAGDGPERERCVALARELGVEDCITFLGHVSDVRRLLLSSRAFVLPSRWEGLSIALLEAMALGMPVIATRVSGSAQVIRHGESGLLTDPEDPEALAGGIEWMLDHAEDGRRMGTAARQVVIRDYSIDAHVASLMEIYGEVVDSPAQAITR